MVFDKGAKSKDNEDMIVAARCHYLTAVKDYEWLRKKIQSVERSSMKRVLKYKTGERVFVHPEENKGVYLYIYYDERRAKQDAKKREKRIREILEEKEEMTSALTT